MKITVRLLRLVLGIFLVSFGIVLTIKANLGLSPWDIFHDGLSKTTPLSFGTAGVFAGIVLIVFLLSFKEKIGFGTVINTVLVGLFIDSILWTGLIPNPKGYIDGFIFMTVGLFIFSYGTYLYISACMGAGPRDGIMVFLVKRTRLPVAVCRILIEGTVSLFGFLLGGMVGVGTIFTVLLAGPIMQLVFSMFKFDVASLKHESFSDTISAFKNADEPA